MCGGSDGGGGGGCGNDERGSAAAVVVRAQGGCSLLRQGGLPKLGVAMGESKPYDSGRRWIQSEHLPAGRWRGAGGG